MGTQARVWRTLHEHGVAIRERDFYRNQYDLAKQMRKDVRDFSARSRVAPFWFALGAVSMWFVASGVLCNPFSDPRQRMDVRESFTSAPQP